MSQGCALLILRSKGQRSRSWRMVIWKWFPDDNWLCNQPMIMKLHTLTPHEFVGVGGGPVLLQQYFQYAFICCPYMLPLLFYLGIDVNFRSLIVLEAFKHGMTQIRTSLSGRSISWNDPWVLSVSAFPLAVLTVYHSWGLQHFQIKISKYFTFKARVNKYHYFNFKNTRVYTYKKITY